MSFESKMKKHIQHVFDENVPNPYEKVEVKKPFAMRRILVPLGVAALACTFVVAVVLPISLIIGKGDNINSIDDNGSMSSNDKPASEENEGGNGSSAQDPENKGFTHDDNFVEKISVCAAPKAAIFSTVSNSFVDRTATKSLARLDNLFKDSSKKNFVVSPASYLLGVSALAAVSDGIELDNYGLTDPLNETKMLLEDWNCYTKEVNSTTGEEEIVSRIDSGVLHQQIGSRFAFDDQKRTSVEDEYIATGIASPSNYRQQAQNYFADNVKLSMLVPDLGLTKDSIVSYSTLKFQDDADIGPTEQRNFIIGQDTISVSACVCGTSEQPLMTEYYMTSEYVAFKRQIRNSSLLFIVPFSSNKLDSITISEVYEDFMQNKQEGLAYGYIPYFHVRNTGMDMSDVVTNDFTGSERLYSKLLKDNVVGSTIQLRMIQNSDYAFVDDSTPQTNNGGSSGSGYSGGSSAMKVDVDRPFYAICLKDDFPMFVSKVTDPRK